MGLSISGEKLDEPIKDSPSPKVMKHIPFDEVLPYRSKVDVKDYHYVLRDIAIAKKEQDKKRALEFKKIQEREAQRLKELEAKRLAELRRAEKAKSTPPLPSRGGGSLKDNYSTKLSNSGVSDSKYYMNLVVQYSQEYGIDPIWVLAMIKTESNFNPNATSSIGAIGLMQILPSTGSSLGISNSSQLYDPQTNIQTGTKYMAYLMNEFGSLKMATIAYNQGEGNVRRGTYRTWYYDKVQANYLSLKR